MLSKAEVKMQFKAKSPIFQGVIPSQTEKKSNVNEQNFIWVMHEGKPYKIPIVSGNSLRSYLRCNIAMDIVEKLGKNSLGYVTLLSLFSGGAIDKKDDKNKSKKSVSDLSQKEIEAKFKALSFIRENNIIFSLFGSSFGSCIIPGKTRVSHIIPVDIIEMKNEDQWVIRYTRRDVLEEDLNKREFLNEEGLRDYINYLIKKESSKQKEENKGENETDENKENKTASKSKDVSTVRSIYAYARYIPAGIELTSEIVINKPTMVELGAICNAIIKLAKDPYIGGLKSKGFGRVSFKANIKAYDGDDNDIFNANIMTPDYGAEGEIESIKPIYIKNNSPDDIKDPIEQYRAYLETLTVEKIEIPKVLLPEKE